MDSFRISDIRLEGLQRVSAGSVFSAFPVTVGDTLDEATLARAMRSLFSTGFFTDIQVGRQEQGDSGYVLVVELVERPSISEIEVEGNKNLPTEDLMDGLKASGLAEGEVFQRSTLERIELEILRSYIAQGRYNAYVDAKVEELPRNRVKVLIDIKEGPLSAIHQINFIGNEAFDDETLQGLMELEVNGFWAGLFNSDKYSKPKLNGDLEKIRSYYLDNGYIRFSIESTQVSLSPDKEQVFLTINVNEGPQYTIRNVEIRGDLKVGEEDLRKLIVVKPGDIFSRQVLTLTSDILTKRLGNDGYTFANVNAIPEPHEDNTATVTFFVEPGQRTYVRRINFRGNTSTSDEAVRQELIQMEGAAASTDLIEASKSQLERTGFFKTVTVETPIVAGTDDQVDVNYNLEEQSTGSLSASLGFSQSSGIVLGASVSEKNFVGTGRRVSFGVNKSESVQSANFSYTNPYFTVDGVSRGFTLSYRETDYSKEDLSSYTSDTIAAGMNFGYPIGRYSRLNFGLGYNHTNIQLGLYPNLDITSYVANYGDSFNFTELSGGWSRNTLNRGVFPTRGSSQRFSLRAAITGLSDEPFYKARLELDHYFPISDNQEWALHYSGNFAYGDGYAEAELLPFFEHYYAGGLVLCAVMTPVRSDGAHRPIRVTRIRLRTPSAVISWSSRRLS
jgi:outer membrane protein insertion porin family